MRRRVLVNNNNKNKSYISGDILYGKQFSANVILNGTIVKIPSANINLANQFTYYIDEPINTLSFNYQNWYDILTLNIINPIASCNKMFMGLSNLRKLTIEKLDTSNVTNMSDMFSHCAWLTTIDLSALDTSKVTDMSWMFWQCSNLTSLDLSNFDISNVTVYEGMFEEADKISHIKCKQAFKDWCATKYLNYIGLYNYNSINWEIVD